MTSGFCLGADSGHRALGVLLGISFEPELSGCAPFGENLRDAESDPGLIAGVAGPLSLR